MNRKTLTIALIAAVALCPLLVIPLFSLGLVGSKLIGALSTLALFGAVTANQVISRQEGVRKSYPVAATTTIYEGTMVFIDSSGYATDVTASGANEFAGVAIRKVDNSAGQNGDQECEVWYTGDFLLAGSGLGQTNVGDKIYASDNYTITTSGTTNTYIGRLARYVSSTAGYVALHDYLDPADMTVENLADDTELYFGDGPDAGIQWSTADASNHAFVIFVDDTAQQLHITDKGARDTDWALSAGTHPEVYIHSNTTPSTDYVRIGNHTGTVADLDVVGGTTLNLQIAGTTYVHVTSAGLDFIDDKGIVLGTGLDAKMIWSTGDASDHGVVLALGDTSQMLHITDLAAVATDWAVTSPTHPTVYIHSNTTPTTDYLSLGAHDGTTAILNVAGGTNFQFALSGTTYATVQVTGLAVGTYVAAATAGTDQLTLKSTGTAPASTGANVGHLYADFETDDDELFWLSGTNGTATQLTT